MYLFVDKQTTLLCCSVQFSEFRMPYRKRLVIYCIYGLFLICCNEHVSLCVISNQISVHLQNFKTAVDRCDYKCVLQMGRYAAGLASPACITLIAHPILLYGTTTKFITLLLITFTVKEGHCEG